MDKTEGFQCLGNSNWTICSPLSHFCYDIFATFTLSYWGTIFYYPRGPIMGKGNSSNSKTEWNSLNHFTICYVFAICSMPPNFVSLICYLSFASAAPPPAGRRSCALFPSCTANALCERRVSRTHPQQRARVASPGGENVRWTICLKRTDARRRRVVYCNSLR